MSRNLRSLHLVMDRMGVPKLKLVTDPPGSGVAVAPESAWVSLRGADELDDAQLVAMVIGGDRGAFERLYRRHAGFAFNLAVRLQGSTTDVEDLVHDAFLKTHQQVSTLRDPGLFRSWIGSIVVSLVRTRMRRRRILRGLGFAAPDPVELESVASADAGPELRAELAQVYALLGVLPSDERIAWTLRYVERNRLEDVARLTNCSLATSKRRIQRAQVFIHEHFVSSERGEHG